MRLMYGPYGKAHNSNGKAALEGEVGEQLKVMREASARTRREHFAKVHKKAEKRFSPNVRNAQKLFFASSH